MRFSRSMLTRAGVGLAVGAILTTGSVLAEPAAGPVAPPPVPALDSPLQLGSVSVEGNKRIASADILAAFGYHDGQNVTRAKLADAQKQVATLYQSRGVGADLGEQLHISANKVDVKLLMREHDQRTAEAGTAGLIVDKVAFEGNRKVPTPALAAATTLQDGAAISDQALAADEVAIEKVYRENKLGAQIQPQVVYPNHDNHLVLVWQIREQSPRSDGE